MRNTNDINADIECLFNAARIIRKCILNLRKDNVVSFEEALVIQIADCGENRDALQMNDARRTSVKQQIASCAKNIMYIGKTERQVSHKTDLNFRTSLDYENKSVISKAILLRQLTRCKKIVDYLHLKGTSIPNSHARQIETALANSVIDSLESSPCGKTLFHFVKKDKFIYFHFGNVDFTIDIPDAKHCMEDLLNFFRILVGTSRM